MTQADSVDPAPEGAEELRMSLTTKAELQNRLDVEFPGWVAHETRGLKYWAQGQTVTLPPVWGSPSWYESPYDLYEAIKEAVSQGLR